MKKVTIFCCFILIFVLRSEKCFSTWGIGAEFSYKCLSGDTYLIEYAMYRPCNGGGPPSIAMVNVTNSCGFTDPYLQLNQISTSLISTVCPTETSSCNGGSYFAVEKVVYQGTITLPGSCEWYFYRRESRRSAMITTTVGSFNDDLFTFFVIDNTNCPCQNSPVFRTSADFRVCVGQPFQFDPHLFDQEGDSISVSLINPRNGPFEPDTVSYLAGYSNTQFLVSNPLISIDHSTGIISGFPTQPDVSPYAILINEFRNGFLIGRTERDVIIYAENCSNNIPVLTGINGSPTNDIAIQPGVQSCFYIASTDLDPFQSTTISYSDSINGLTVVTSGGIRDSAFICWTPSMADVSQVPYCFDLNVADDNCPYLGISTRTICITVDLSADIQDDNHLYFEISPNPVTDQLKISGLDFSNVKIQLYDLAGRRVLEKKVSGLESFLDCSKLKNGIYLLSISSVNSGHTIWKKLLKN